MRNLLMAAAFGLLVLGSCPHASKTPAAAVALPAPAIADAAPRVVTVRRDCVIGFDNAEDAWAYFGYDGGGAGTTHEERDNEITRIQAGLEHEYAIRAGARLEIILEQVPERPTLAFVAVSKGQKITRLPALAASFDVDADGIGLYVLWSDLK